ncbi:MAG: DUF4139 domain-containing protein [candidate division NC10 bacterium RIFCSPLOWO2_12_FULL_66_18]|nr:MAG: DUF4139 domain-containing protein [candidate division NC10 bacterium RIFCSPLOWO2_02_FULL_66_22]OGB96915.1 MAG: DUF4139 domain-containing protein [candidate division NC10 bacterium RIFCSPLOWO2_12_FULL_66_18]
MSVGLAAGFLCVSAVPAASGVSRAAVTQENQKEVAITIYNGNLGLVKDVRDLVLGPGIHEVKFMDVAAQIDPTTVHLKSLTDAAGVRILEQNYEYDLLNPQKLLDKFVGKTVKLMVGDGSLIDAVLLSNNNGPIYKINGQIHLGHHGRVILPDLPDNLIPKPTLVWLLQNRTGRPQRVEASYLTGGITWKADYVVVLNAKDNGGDLSGWVTIDNKSGATYPDAALKLVAGDVNRAVGRRELRDGLELASKVGAAETPRQFQQESFFEYHLYSLDGRTTIKQNQTKQISLLDVAEIPIKKELRFYGASQYYRGQLGTPISNQKVSVFLEIANKEQHRLGMPLPKGIVRVYKAASDRSLQFIGEDVIDHTPKDEKVKIKMGEAFDVVGERTQRDWRKIAPGLYETEWDVQVRNHKKEDVQVTIIEPVPGDWDVIKTSHPYEKAEAHTLKYTVNVPKDGKTTVNYRVRMRW